MRNHFRHEMQSMDNDTAQSVFPNNSVRRIVRLFLVFSLGLAQVLTSWSQESGAAGALRLRVFDLDWAAPLPDATVSIVENGMKRASDESGNVLFDTLPEGTYTVVVGASGFERKVLSSVTVVGGTVRTEDVRLHAEFTDMDEFVVKDVDFSIGGSDMAQLEIRSQSSSIMDNIGADMMSKAGVSTAAAALRLVTGTSVQDGKYAVIRGLGDRYTSTLLNGVRLPTSDKERRAVQMDQFPAAMIESIQVTKTFMPDQQGDASGGGINIVTRGVPQKSILSASISTEYDSEATGNGDFKTYAGGGNDFGGLRGVENMAFWNSGSKETPRGSDEKYSSKIESESPSPNHGFKFAAGDVWRLGEDASAGVLLNGSYSEKYKYRESVKKGTRNQGGTKGTNVITDVEDVTQVYTSTDEQLWSFGATMGVKNENNEIKLTGLYTHLSRDIVELRYDDLTPMEHPATTTNVTRGKITGYQDEWHRGRAVKGVMQYSETGNGSLQLAGKHTVEPLNNTEFDWTGAYNVSETIEPDRRAFTGNYFYNHTIMYDKNHNETSNSEESR